MPRLKGQLEISTMFVLTLVMLVSPAAGQSTATLTGQVLDQSKAAVPAAQITLRNMATGIESTVRTDSRGYYQLPPSRLESTAYLYGRPAFKLMSSRTLRFRWGKQRCRISISRLATFRRKYA